MHYRIQLHWPWFIVCNGKYFDTLVAFMKCYQYQLVYFLAPHWYCRPWHFAQFIVNGPWAKIARRYRTLLPLAGVGNTPQSGEEKTSCHTFSVELFANSDFEPYIVLYCGALWKRKKELVRPSLLFVFLTRQVRLHYQDSYDLLPLSLIQLI